MARRHALTAIIVTLFLAASTLIADDFQHVCSLRCKTASGKSIELSGFKLKDREGIFTALHGVAGATEVVAVFNSPATRRIDLDLKQVDIARDVAFLEPADGIRLPSGGLTLGPRPTDEKLNGMKVFVVGYPIGLDLHVSRTELLIRTPAIQPLTELLNSAARNEIVERGSPSKETRMLNLQGFLLPGHSGAPVLNDEGAVIGIGGGGLKQGTVGHGWASVLRDVDLKPVTDPDVARELDRLKPPLNCDTLFAVINEKIREAGQRYEFVTDHDGAGALLMTEPDFEAFIASSIGAGDTAIGRLLNGTPVEILESNAGNMRNGPPWVKVKVLVGDYAEKTGWILQGFVRRAK